MKSVIRPLALVLLLFLLLSLCACGAAPTAPDGAREEQPSPLAACAGLYTLFGVSYEDRIVEAAVFDFSSTLELLESGDGSLVLNGESGSVSSWSVEGDTLRVVSTLGRFSGTLSQGVAVLSADGETLLYYAAQDADLAAYPTLDGDAFVELIVSEALGDSALPDLSTLFPAEEEAAP